MLLRAKKSNVANFSLKDPKIVSVIGLVSLVGYITDTLLFPGSNKLMLLNLTCVSFTTIALGFHLIKKPKIELSLALFALILLINLLVAPFFQLNEPDFSSFYIRNTLIFWIIMPLLGLTIHKNMFLFSAIVYLVQFGIILWVSDDTFLLNSSGTMFLVLIGYIYVILFLLRTLEDASMKTEILISDLRDKNNELLNKREELNSLLKTKNKLFSIIAHDLQSPFMGITELSKMIKTSAKEGKTEDVIEYSSMITDSAIRTNTLFSNLLDWANSQTGKLKMEPKTKILDDYLDETIELLKDLQQKKQISIERINTDLNVYADPNCLKTVFRNLISNALKFTPENGQIKISAQEHNGQTVISVSDNGIGIKEDIMPMLFNSDSYFTTSGTNQEKGTGLGLSLSKDMIEKHGGEIWVENNSNKGVIFHFSLPKNI